MASSIVTRSIKRSAQEQLTGDTSRTTSTTSSFAETHRHKRRLARPSDVLDLATELRHSIYDELISTVKAQIPLPLTKRIFLEQVSGLIKHDKEEVRTDFKEFMKLRPNVCSKLEFFMPDSLDGAGDTPTDDPNADDNSTDDVNITKYIFKPFLQSVKKVKMSFYDFEHTFNYFDLKALLPNLKSIKLEDHRHKPILDISEYESDPDYAEGVRQELVRREEAFLAEQFGSDDKWFDDEGYEVTMKVWARGSQAGDDVFVTYNWFNNKITAYGRGECPQISDYTAAYDKPAPVTMPEKARQHCKVTVTTPTTITYSMQGDELGSECYSDKCGCCDSKACRALRDEPLLCDPPTLNGRGDCCRISSCQTCRYGFGPEDEDDIDCDCDCHNGSEVDKEDGECCSCERREKDVINEMYPTYCCGIDYHSEESGCEYQDWEKRWDDLPSEWFVEY